LEVDFEDHRATSSPASLSTGGRGNGHGHVCEQLGLRYVVGDERLQRLVAVPLEFALDEVRAAAATSGNVGDADAFCWS
jgi:hypothetical protein